MTAGLPGAGIGGIFYMLSAIGMPFHALWRSARRRSRGESGDGRPTDWPTIMLQFAIAIGIVAALWITGWLLAKLIVTYPQTIGRMSSTPRHAVPNVLKVGALILSLGTLSVALVAVQVARLVVKTRNVPKRTLAAVALLAALATSVARAQAPPHTAPANVASHLAAAESAYNSGQTAQAIVEYSAVLAADPDNSRALFRLGQLTSDDPRRSIPLFRRYVAIVSGDAWGHMALGDELARDGRLSTALAEYDAAESIAPGNRDVAIGRARILASAGRTDAAIVALEEWTSTHAGDAEALRDLGDQRRRAGRLREAASAYRLSAARDGSVRSIQRLDAVRAASAPAIDVATAGAGDSDGNRSYRVGASVGGNVADRARLLIAAGRKSITGFTDAAIYDAAFGIAVRPQASFRFEASAGAVRASVDTTGLSAATGSADLKMSVVPGRGRGNGGGAASPPPGTVIHAKTAENRTVAVGSARGVWKQPGGAGMVDLRASRILLDANGILVINHVVRNEVAGRVDIPLANRIRLRGGAKTDSYDGTGDSNTRMSLLGGVAVSATDAVEISGIFQQIAFDHSTTSGYFAPRVAQLAELGSYAELESDGGSLLVLDGGIGGQRFGEFGSAIGNWKPAFRVFAQLTVPISPGSEFRAEVDSYDSRLGSEIASSESWRYLSGSLSLRFALR